METRRTQLPWLLAMASLVTLMLTSACRGESLRPDQSYETVGPLLESSDKLHTLLDIRKILIKEKEERIEQADYEDQHQVASKEKKSSVSWLLAAAIRMCKELPEQCLRQRRLHENYATAHKKNVPANNFDFSNFMKHYKR